MKAENVLDYELGYRNQVNRRMSVDVTAFYSNYAGLRTLDPGTPFVVATSALPYMVFPEMWGNLGWAHDYGIELSGSWDVTSRWRLSPGFSFLQMNLQPSLTATPSAFASPGYTPQHQGQLRSSVKLSHRLEWDTSAYLVSRLSNGPAPAYNRLDTRLGWTMGEFMYFSVSGQNLLSARHFEFLNGYQVHPTEVERSVVAKITLRF